MSKGLYVALSGAIAQQDALDATASNVANAASPGYQRLRPIFRQALATAEDDGRSDPNLRYASVARTALDTTPGAPRATHSPLDAVLPQGAYVALSTARGERYTRGCSLALADDGTLKTTSGVPVVGEGDVPIQATPGAGPVMLDRDGNVKQAGAAIGKLKMVRFAQPDALAPEGSGTLSAAQAGAATPSTDPIEVGSVEESNAQPVTEMTDLMTATRTFDAFQKVLDTLGDVDHRLLTTVPNADD